MIWQKIKIHPAHPPKKQAAPTLQDAMLARVSCRALMTSSISNHSDKKNESAGRSQLLIALPTTFLDCGIAARFFANKLHAAAGHFSLDKLMLPEAAEGSFQAPRLRRACASSFVPLRAPRLRHTRATPLDAAPC